MGQKNIITLLKWNEQNTHNENKSQNKWRPTYRRPELIFEYINKQMLDETWIWDLTLTTKMR